LTAYYTKISEINQSFFDIFRLFLKKQLKNADEGFFIFPVKKEKQAKYACFLL